VILQLGGLGEGLLFTIRNQLATKCYTGPWNWLAPVNMVNEPSNSIKGGKFLEKLSDR
jgi:hypothetical protein